MIYIGRDNGKIPSTYKETITRMDLRKNDGRMAIKKMIKYNKCKWDMGFNPYHLNIPVTMPCKIRMITRAPTNKRLKYQRSRTKMPCKIMRQLIGN